MYNFIMNTEAKNEKLNKNHRPSARRFIIFDLTFRQILNCFNVPPRGKGSNHCSRRISVGFLWNVTTNLRNWRKNLEAGTWATYVLQVWILGTENALRYCSWRWWWRPKKWSFIIHHGEKHVGLIYMLCYGVGFFLTVCKLAAFHWVRCQDFSFFFFWQAGKRPCGDVACPPSGIEWSIAAYIPGI